MGSGLKPALPSNANADQFRRITGSTLWTVGKKFDGFRACWDGTQYITRNGTPLTKPHPAELIEFGRALAPGLYIDGELIGGRLHVFDFVHPDPWEKRLAALPRLADLAAKLDAPVEIVEQYTGDAMLDAMHRWVDGGCEGFVFKRLASPYPAGKGRENRTTAWLKWKLVETVDCVITDRGINDKNNFELSVYRDGELVSIGKCSSVTGDGPRCNVGDVVEVTVLDFTSGGRLLQCVRPILRTDKDPVDCTWEQVETIRKEDMR